MEKDKEKYVTIKVLVGKEKYREYRLPEQLVIDRSPLWRSKQEVGKRIADILKSKKSQITELKRCMFLLEKSHESWLTIARSVTEKNEDFFLNAVLAGSEQLESFEKDNFLSSDSWTKLKDIANLTQEELQDLQASFSHDDEQRDLDFPVFTFSSHHWLQQKMYEKSGDRSIIIGEVEEHGTVQEMLEVLQQVEPEPSQIGNSKETELIGETSEDLSDQTRTPTNTQNTNGNCNRTQNLIEETQKISKDLDVESVPVESQSKLEITEEVVSDPQQHGNKTEDSIVEPSEVISKEMQSMSPVPAETEGEKSDNTSGKFCFAAPQDLVEQTQEEKPIVDGSTTDNNKKSTELKKEKSSRKRPAEKSNRKPRTDFIEKAVMKAEKNNQSLSSDHNETVAASQDLVVGSITQESAKTLGDIGLEEISHQTQHQKLKKKQKKCEVEHSQDLAKHVQKENSVADENIQVMSSKNDPETKVNKQSEQIPQKDPAEKHLKEQKQDVSKNLLVKNDVDNPPSTISPVDMNGSVDNFLHFVKTNQTENSTENKPDTDKSTKKLEVEHLVKESAPAETVKSSAIDPVETVVTGSISTSMVNESTDLEHDKKISNQTTKMAPQKPGKATKKEKDNISVKSVEKPSVQVQKSPAPPVVSSEKHSDDSKIDDCLHFARTNPSECAGKNIPVTDNSSSIKTPALGHGNQEPEKTVEEDSMDNVQDIPLPSDPVETVVVESTNTSSVNEATDFGTDKNISSQTPELAPQKPEKSTKKVKPVEKPTVPNTTWVEKVRKAPAPLVVSSKKLSDDSEFPTLGTPNLPAAQQNDNVWKQKKAEREENARKCSSESKENAVKVDEKNKESQQNSKKDGWITLSSKPLSPEKPRSFSGESVVKREPNVSETPASTENNTNNVERQEPAKIINNMSQQEKKMLRRQRVREKIKAEAKMRSEIKKQEKEEKQFEHDQMIAYVKMEKQLKQKQEFENRQKEFENMRRERKFMEDKRRRDKENEEKIRNLENCRERVADYAKEKPLLYRLIAARLFLTQRIAMISEHLSSDLCRLKKEKLESFMHQICKVEQMSDNMMFVMWRMNQDDNQFNLEDLLDYFVTERTYGNISTELDQEIDAVYNKFCEDKIIPKTIDNVVKASIFVKTTLHSLTSSEPISEGTERSKIHLNNFVFEYDQAVRYINITSFLWTRVHEEMFIIEEDVLLATNEDNTLRVYRKDEEVEDVEEEEEEEDDGPPPEVKDMCCQTEGEPYDIQAASFMPSETNQ